MSFPLIQLTRQRVLVGPRGDLLSAGDRFASQRHLLLPRFFDPELLMMLQRRLATAAFTTRIAHGVYPPAVDLKLDDPALRGACHLLMNDALLRDAIETITGFTSLTAFAGAVYRIQAAEGHRDSWHDDVDGQRRVAITVNLSDAAFDGGELQMREKQSGHLLWRFANTGPGDALLFAIDPSLEHCIAPMAGRDPKTALAGWFCVT